MDFSIIVQQLMVVAELNEKEREEKRIALENQRKKNKYIKKADRPTVEDKDDCDE
jgi:hypothetical protein